MIEVVPDLEQENEVMQDLLHMRDLLAQGDVEGARAYINELARKWPDAERVQHYARVLAPPKVLGTGPGTGRSLKPEREWLRAHAKEYPGCWLAIEGDRLIAANPDLRVVLDAIEQADGVTDPLLHLQQAPPR